MDGKFKVKFQTLRQPTTEIRARNFSNICLIMLDHIMG